MSLQYNLLNITSFWRTCP